MRTARLRQRILAAAAILLLLGSVGWLSGKWAERWALSQLAVQARDAAALRRAYLLSEIERYRLLPIALADDRDLIAGLTGPADRRNTLDLKLERLARTTGAAEIYVLDQDGRTIASSNFRSPPSFVGQDYRFRNYFREAQRSGQGSQFALGTISGRPGLYLSQRSSGNGYVVVKLEFDRVEREWARRADETFVTSRDGIVLISSQPGWRFTTTRPLSPDAIHRFRTELQSGQGSLTPWPVQPVTRLAQGSIVRAPGTDGPLLLWQQVPVGERGWQLNLLTPLRSVRTAVRSARIGAVLASLVLLGLGWALRERMQRRRDRSALIAARTLELESVVERRTADLRREMDERIASEARADDLREGLRQANRLASLGQITAGIAHETAQPVAAIRSYAANSRQLLDRGDTDRVRDNLQTIERLTERIGAVTAELRGFARKRSGTIAPTPLIEAIDGALLILKARLARVRLDLPDISHRLVVLADKIPLEQVLVNLLQNALEALEGRPDPRIEIEVAATENRVRMCIRDNGPGIDPAVAGQLFTPFVTSRPNGLGLGLVIASDIMEDMGGVLRLVPGTGGAVFEVELRRG